MRWFFTALLAGCSATSGIADDTGSGDEPRAASYDSSHYSVCAACHLADGNGIPGAFPPIRNRSAAMASVEGGREYLVTVVSYGLMGKIEADGMAYAGVMPGHKGTMQADAIAAALNYLVFELNDKEQAGADIEPFTADEVGELQSGIAGGSPMTAARLRVGLLERHGDQWPQ